MECVANSKSLMAVGKILNDPTRPLAERYRALFTLRNLGGDVAVDQISECFSDASALLKHECAYCLGQMQNVHAVPILSQVLQDVQQDTMVRHEAGEALGAIGSEDVLDLLQKHCDDPVTEVAETCQLAVERIKWMHSNNQENLGPNPYHSVDPAPPLEISTTESLKETLLNEDIPLFKRYRAMFALRNIGDSASVLALGEGLKCKSALFRHEIAYVLGQMQKEEAIEQLRLNLQDSSENAMVRHECAEALGSIATKDCMNLLQEYLKDTDIVVKESCEVALDMADHEASGQFQYADGLSRINGTECKS